MDGSRFDRIARRLASRRLSRRTALSTGGAGLAATLLARAGVAAQGTPGANRAVDALYAQNFDSGSFVPKAGAAGDYTLTLQGVPEATVWFADRPERAAGTTPTAKFVDGRAFSPTDPPNAAIVAQTSIGQDTLVVELRDPKYDAGARTVTYDARVIDSYQREGLAFLAKQQNDHTIEARFNAGSLFVDQLRCSPAGGSCQGNSECCSGLCCGLSGPCPFATCT